MPYQMRLSNGTEECHQTALFTYLERIRARYPVLKLLHHIPNGGLRSKATAGKFKAMGTKKGVPDLSLPVARGGYFGMYIEMKKPAGPGSSRAGTTTPDQRAWISDLREQGYCVKVAFGWEEALEFLLQYLAQEPTINRMLPT